VDPVLPGVTGNGAGILLDAGSNDDYNLHWGHRLLSHHLHEAGIAMSTERTPETTAAERSSGTRWRWNGCRKS
jgi:hypothetical protein